jgi:hypothetical protein
MFCDLVGSTKIAATRRRGLAQPSQRLPRRGHEGGDRVRRARFEEAWRWADGPLRLSAGARKHAERAVRAALAIQHALGEISARSAGKASALVARNGLDSGPVVVDAAGEVFGEAPNIAARVQGVAEPGSLLITLNMQRKVAGRFLAEERDARELNGVSGPVRLFRADRASGVGRRGGGRAQTEFVGREEELSLLARRWERARAGRASSRSSWVNRASASLDSWMNFIARLAETPHTWVEWRDVAPGLRRIWPRCLSQKGSAAPSNKAAAETPDPQAERTASHVR